MEGIEKKQLDKFCKKLEAIRWKKIEFEEVRNDLFEDSIIWDKFVSKIKELNRSVFEKYKDEDVIIKLIKFKLNSAKGEEILNFMKFGIPIDIKNTVERIKLIDFTNLERNDYAYIREFSVPRKDLVGNDKADIMLFVNGIPMIIVEGKRAIGVSTWYEGLKQLMRYQYEMRNIFKYLQYGVVVADNDYYMPVFDRQRYEEPINYSQWKVKIAGKYKSNILDLLTPERFLDMLFFFTFYTYEGKIGPRYMQYFAVKKLIKRADNYLSGNSKRNRGLIWHWQGSGKTEEMFFSAFYFLTKYKYNNPVVFVVIDRTQLGSQSSESFRRFRSGYLESYIEVVSSINRLKSIIKNINKEFGIKILTIQKFRNKDFKDIKPVEKRNILFLIDEAHRTQYGELAAVRKRIFPNALSFGFTGTPIFKYERNTFREFGYPDDPESELYLDVYFIEQSINDGYTVPIVVETVKENYLRSTFTEKEIKEIFEKYYMDENSAQIIDQLNRTVRKKVNRDITRKRVILENDSWIKKTVEEIKRRIKLDTENFTFKAMIVASSRRACVKYKKYMDEIFGDSNFSAVVMSYSQNEDDVEVGEFKNKLIKKYNTTDMNEINEKIKNEFLNNKDGNPHVLIVTDMLITGFNAPQLKVIYLNKVLFLHRLLQMVARTNRPYLIEKDGIIIKKEHGLIVDFVGLVDVIQKSIGIYKFLANEKNAKEFSKDLSQAFVNPENQLKIMSNHLYKIEEIFCHLNKEYELGITFKDLVRLVEKKEVDREFWKNLASKIALHYNKSDKYYEEIRKMIKSLKEIKEIYISLGAYPGKLDYKLQFLTVTLLYSWIYWVMNQGKRKNLNRIIKEMLCRVYSSTEIGEFDTIFLEKIITPTAIKPKLKESLAAMEFFTLKNSLEEKLGNPIYREIYNKIIRILESWSSREISLQTFLEEIENEKKKVTKLENKGSLDSKIFAYVHQLLKDKGIDFKDKDALKPLNKVMHEIIEEGRMLDYQKKNLERSVKLFVYKLKKKKLIEENINEIKNLLVDVLISLVEEEINDKYRRNYFNF